MSTSLFSTADSGAVQAFKEASGDQGSRETTYDKAPFSMRLSAKEREYLNEHAGGRTWAAYIRECVFGEQAAKRRATRRPRIEDQQLATVLSELGRSRLASNVNQLAKSANSGTLDVSTDVERQLEEACLAILAMREALITALGLKS